MRIERLAVCERWLVGLAGSAHIFAMENDGLRLVSSVGSVRGSYSDACMHRGALLLSDRERGLIVVDMEDAEEPRIVAGLRPDIEDFRPETVTVVGELAILGSSEVTCVVDVSNPRAPVSLGWLPIGLGMRRPLWETSQARCLLPDSSGRLWALDLEATPTVTGVSTLLSVDELEGDHGASLYGSEKGLLVAETLLRFSESGQAIAFERERCEAWQGSQHILAMRKALLQWIQERLGEVHQGALAGPIGILELRTWYDAIALSFDTPRSRACIRSVDEFDVGDDEEESPFPSFEISFEELAGELPVPPSEAPYGPLQRRRDVHMARAWEQCAKDVFRDLQASTALAHVAAGRVYLVVQVGEFPRRVADTAFFPGAPWRPQRKEAGGFEQAAMQSLLDEHQGYRFVGLAESRARRREDDRHIVWELARAGRSSALAVAVRLADSFSQDVRAVLLAAGSAGFFDARGLALMARAPLDDELRDLFESAFASPHLSEKLAAADALDRLDSDALQHAIAEGFSSSSGAQSHEALVAAEALPDPMLGAMREHLVVAFDAMWSGSSDFTRLARLLFRAGHPNAPKRLVDAADAERPREVEGGLFAAHLAELAPRTALAAQRLWTGRALAEHILSVRSAGDSQGSLVPESIRPETSPLGWRRLFEAAWPYLEKAEALDWLLKRLSQRGREHALRRAALRILLNAPTPPKEAVRELAEAALADDAGAEDARHALTWLTLEEGWAPVSQEDYAGAKNIAESILQQDPNERQALFLRGRVLWLESSPEECESFVLEALTKLKRPTSRYERVTHAKLLNLRGCALEARKAYDEAIVCIEEAARLAPGELSYLGNLAELHDACGRTEQAYNMLMDLQARGYEPDCAQRIIEKWRSA